MLQNLLIMAVLFGLLFLLGELLYRKLRWKAENSRKFVHVSVGLLAMGFPLAFQTLWPVVVLCGCFLLILLLSLWLGFLPSVNKVKRKTVGSILFPVIVGLCFWMQLSMQNPLYFYLPILIMAVCDPLASTVGNAIGAENKSFRGSLAFFAGAFVLSLTLFWYQENWETSLVLLTSLGMAFTTAVAEFLSRKGWDNFSIPAVAVLTLLLIENTILWK